MYYSYSTWTLFFSLVLRSETHWSLSQVMISRKFKKYLQYNSQGAKPLNEEFLYLLLWKTYMRESWVIFSRYENRKGFYLCPSRGDFFWTWEQLIPQSTVKACSAGEIFYDIPSMRNLNRNFYKLTYLQNRNRLRDLGYEFMVTRGDRWGEGIVIEFGMDMYTHCI